MTTFQTGADALDLLMKVGSDSGGTTEKITKFKSGDKRVVRVVGEGFFHPYISYGNYQAGIKTFEPDNPPTLNDRGYPKSNLTPFDKAFNYFNDKKFEAKKAGDEDAQKEFGGKANVFRAKVRALFALYDLNEGKIIYIDLTQKQGQDVYNAIHKLIEKGKLDKKAFEIEKTGEQKDTKVTATALDLDDLSDAQLAKFEGVNVDEIKFNYEGLTFVSDEKQQLELLQEQGFDLSLIGYAGGNATDQAPADESETDFPF